MAEGRKGPSVFFHWLFLILTIYLYIIYNINNIKYKDIAIYVVRARDSNNGYKQTEFKELCLMGCSIKISFADQSNSFKL